MGIKSDRMSQLVQLLNKYAYDYYVLDNPTVSDKEYDLLYDELVELETTLGYKLADSPTMRVGGDPIKEFLPHKHINRLYSLDKVKTYEGLLEWDKKIREIADAPVEYTLEYKLDGLTLCLTYENGVFVSGATRGNGVVGENVTEQIKTIKSIPLTIPYKGLIEVQGEGIMRLSALEKYNLTATEPLKNARNGVAGAIRNLDPKVTASRNLDIVFYNVNYYDEEIITQKQMIDLLKNNYFKTEKLLVTSDINKIIDEIKHIDRSSLDFDIDGMVVKVNNVKLRSVLGYTDKFPRWAIAYKFEAEETTTILKDVKWQVGRTGKLTPLAILEPVELCGATVKRATLNNYADILRKKIKIGSRILIRRSNDVIPEVLGVAEDLNGKEIDVPLKCPACGGEIVKDGAHIFCTNEDCKPKICARLAHFVSKDCMDIEGISEKTIETLYDKVGIRCFNDLYVLTPNDFSKLEGFKDKKTSKILKSVKDSKNVALGNYINALGIPNVGKKLAADLASIYKNISSLMNASESELSEIADVGPITARDICLYFTQNRDLIEKLKILGIDPVATDKTNGVFSGMKIVLTGTLSEFKRSEAVELIEKAGGEVQSSVTASTSLVIAGENAGSKLEKAKKSGIKIINEKDFKDLLNA